MADDPQVLQCPYHERCCCYNLAMQTYLPYPDFAATAACLDMRRLCKQRVEAFQILRAISDPMYGWQRHPAVQMWRDYPDALADYMNGCMTEWIRRGHRNTMQIWGVQTPYLLPHWLGDPDFHAAHRAALLYKGPVHYSQFGWRETPEINYVWPVGLPAPGSYETDY